MSAAGASVLEEKPPKSGAKSAPSSTGPALQKLSRPAAAPTAATRATGGEDGAVRGNDRTPLPAQLSPSAAPTAPPTAPSTPKDVMTLHAAYGNAALARAATTGSIAMPPKPGASPYSPSAAPAAAAVSTSVEPHAQISISAAPSSAATTPAATAKESISAAAPGVSAYAPEPAHQSASTAAAPYATTGSIAAAAPPPPSSAPAPAGIAPATSAIAPPAPVAPAAAKPASAASAPPTPAGGAAHSAKGAPAHEKARAPGGEAGTKSEALAGKAAGAAAEKDPAFQTVILHAKVVAKHQATHVSAKKKVAEVHAAAISPPREVPSRAASRQTDAMEQEKPKRFNRQAFKDALLARIKPPETLEDADNFKDQNNLAEVKAGVNSQVADEKKKSQRQLPEKVEESPKADGIEPKPHTDLPPPDVGQAYGVAAAGAAPKRVGDAEIDLSPGPKEADQKMAEAGVTEEQLQQSNEPAFQSAASQKKGLEKESVAAPHAYRKQEVGMLAAARTDAQSVANTHTAQMHAARKHAMTEVHGHQNKGKEQEERQRAEIAAHIEGIYTDTQTAVKGRLKKLDEDANQTFDQGASHAQARFETYVGNKMDAYKDDRYGGWTGWAKWGKDKLFGMPDDVNVFYEDGQKQFVQDMGEVIDRIATIVETGLNEAMDLIVLGKAKIDRYIHVDLPAGLQDVGKQAATGIEKKFEALEQSVNDKQDQLVESLAKKYTDNMTKLNDRIEEMKKANQGLVDAVVGAIAGVIRTILALKDMLLNVISRAASAIGMIIAHPIAFLGNLVDAGKTGFLNFKDHIVEHLEKGFMEWLFGAVAAAGIQLPKKFDLAGIFGLAMQILGLTYANIRSRAVKILGEKVVKSLESAAEVFKVLIAEGPAGLWRFIKDKLGDLQVMVIDKIKAFVMEKIIIAGVTWLIGLLNPASAFIKACKAIYDIIMFFVDHGKQILDLVNAIIDSITAIAKGAIRAAAAMVEESLARAIPVIIGFLGSLLGVSGISDKIKEVIDAIRAPINAAIDWVITKALDLAKAAGGFLGIGKKPEKAEDQPVASVGIDAAVQESLHTHLGAEATIAKTETALPQILHELAPMGLKSLILGPADADGVREILAEASPRKRVAKLRHKKITVAVSAKIQIDTKQEDILSGMLHGPTVERTRSGSERFWPGESLLFSEFHEDQKEALGGTGKAATLPPVSQPPRTRAKRGDQAAAGLIVEPEKGSSELEILAWNTSQPEKGHNVSHAERQFVDWFESRPGAWLKRVVSVNIDVEGRAVCDECLADLKRLRSRFPKIKFSWTGDHAKDSEVLEVE